MGILANMACTSEVCKAMMAHSTLRYSSLLALANFFLLINVFII